MMTLKGHRSVSKEWLLYNTVSHKHTHTQCVNGGMIYNPIAAIFKPFYQFSKQRYDSHTFINTHTQIEFDTSHVPLPRDEFGPGHVSLAIYRHSHLSRLLRSQLWPVPGICTQVCPKHTPNIDVTTEIDMGRRHFLILYWLIILSRVQRCRDVEPKHSSEWRLSVPKRLVPTFQQNPASEHGTGSCPCLDLWRRVQYGNVLSGHLWWSNLE